MNNLHQTQNLHRCAPLHAHTHTITLKLTAGTTLKLASQLDHQLKSKCDVKCKQGDRSSCLCDKCLCCSKLNVFHEEKIRELICHLFNVQPMVPRVICV